MYSENTYSTYRNTMIASVNCLILGEASKNNFNVVVGEVYTNDDKIDVAFDQFTVSNFKELLFRRNKVKKAVQDSDSMDLYKVELIISSLKDKIYTMDEIKDNGTMMESMLEFKEYFNNDDKKPKQRCLHIFIVPTIVAPATATGQKRSADLESAETGPKRLRRFVYNQKDLEKLVSEIERNVIVRPPPELYPELSKNIAGRFHKQESLIPISGKNFPDMRLTEQFVSPMGQKLTSLFDGKKNVFQMIYGVSGAGKTRAIFDMARSLFIIYIDCAPPRDETMAYMEPTSDTNFSDLVEKVNSEFTELPVEKARIRADYLIALEFIARVIYLILLKKVVRDLNSRQYLLAQINGGQECIAEIKYGLASYEFGIDDLKSIFRIALGHLEEQLGKRPIFAIDEANVAITKYFFGNFKNLHGKPRGLLTPMVVFLFKQRASIVISGTSFSLSQGESVLSDIGKGVTNEYLDEFGSFTIENVESYLESLLDLSDCDFKSIKEFKCLTGRPRFASRLVVEIIRVENKCGKAESKQNVLIKAIEATIKAISDRLKSSLDKFINDANTDNDKYGWKDIMLTLFISCWFFGGYVSRYELDDRARKLIDSGIAHLSENDNNSLVIDEPLSVDVVKTVLLPIYQSPDNAILQKLSAELKRKAYDRSNTSKGSAWQYLAQARLMSFNGRTVANFVRTIYGYEIFEMGGIKKTNLPEWTTKAIINIKSYGDLDKLCWQLCCKYKDDVEFIEMLLEDPTKRESMLDPNNIMRPDGVYIGNNIYHSDDYWTLLISAKIYGSLLSKKVISNDKRTTNWRYVYYEDSEDEKTQKIKKYVIRERLDTIRDKYKHQGSIRIHFILPGLAESKDKSEDRGGCRVEGNDIIMYIDQNLLKKYFQPQYVDVINNILS